MIRFRLAIATALAASVLAIPACDDGDATPPTGTPGDHQAVTLAFEARVGDALAACGVDYAGLGSSAAATQLADARVFVSELALRDATGAWQPVTLDQASIWQHQNVALLDFEDGSGACHDSGTDETNSTVTGTVPSGTYDALRFRVGVPFALNHLDSASAPAPLNAPGMFWAWQGGYKFVRVDFAVAGGDLARWNVHVGSTQCVSAASTAPPDAVCGRPNAATITLDGFDPFADAAPVVIIDLAALVAGADLLTNAASSPPGCMSAPGEPTDCAPIFSALGVDFETGACAGDCAGQSAFRID